MKKSSQYMVSFSLTFCLWAAAGTGLTAAEKAADKRPFTAQQQTARQKILDSEHWKETQNKFKQWRSVQTTYDPKQLARQEAELNKRIASMSATELQQFLAAMDERLEVLLSPEMDQARRWVDHYYTPKGQRKMIEKLGVADPFKMTGDQLRAALERFHHQRASDSQSAAAFNRSRQNETKALNSYRAQERSAQARARSAQRSATYGSHAPKKTRKQQTRYPSGWTAGWRGWGGW